MAQNLLLWQQAHHCFDISLSDFTVGTEWGWDWTEFLTTTNNLVLSKP